jgi:3-phosphoglycerate kinase
MENISEIKKNKVGRPKNYPSMERNLLRIGGDLQLTTQRNLNNQVYVTIAQGVLMKTERIEDFIYLMDAKKEKYYRSVILQHLGRLSEKYPNQEETIIQIAQNICKERMNTNKAIEYINEVRNKAGENFAENKVEGTS